MTGVHAELNGKIFPSNSYDLDFASNNRLQAYNDLLDTLGRLNESSGELPFSRLVYNKGSPLFGFDFTGSRTGLKAVALIKQGNLNVHMKFRVALPQTVVVFAMLIYDNVIQITYNRGDIFNFAP